MARNTVGLMQCNIIIGGCARRSKDIVDDTAHGENRWASIDFGTSHIQLANLTPCCGLFFKHCHCHAA